MRLMLPYTDPWLNASPCLGRGKLTLALAQCSTLLFILRVWGTLGLHYSVA